MNRLLVISSAPLISKEGTFFAYSPYEKEMQIWAKHTEEIAFCCPIWKEDKGLLIAEISFKIHKIIPLKEFNIKTIPNTLKSIYYSIINCFILFKAIKNANHIHMRCPGNVTLLAAFIQVFFPKKIKTVKYAGNWDPKSQQPLSYKLQRWILSNTFLSKNTQVLVYGSWDNQTKNIKPFFTASYSESDKKEVKVRKLEDEIKFLFVGTLSKGKQPLYVIQLVEELRLLQQNVYLELYGEGVLRKELEAYITNRNLEAFVIIKGNQSKECIQNAYQHSHFLVLPSKSEGWPKVVAEAMFWGCLPIVTKISCVPYMLEDGNRGLLIDGNLTEDVQVILNLINTPSEFENKANKALNWSREFTLEKFENEIKALIQYN